MNEQFHSGFVTLAGKPNVGKSTLVNLIVGEKVSIISDKPQTTRNQIRGIYTQADAQIIFIDTPGIHSAKNKLGEYMVKAAQQAWWDADVILAVLDASIGIREADKEMLDAMRNCSCEVVVVLNKIDLLENRQDIMQLIEELKLSYEYLHHIIPMSAAKGEGKKQLLDILLSLLPEGPKYFPDDMYTDQPEKVLVAEIIREKTLQLLREEIPHGIGVDILSMKERTGNDIIDVHANIICERLSHKSIIIGKGGKMLREIGTRARLELERVFDTKMNLQLWVKVQDRWRNSQNIIRELGYDERDL